MAVRSDITVNWNLSPRVITVQAPSTEVTIQDLHDTLRDLEDEPLEMTYGSTASTGSIIETAGKESLGGGVSVGLTATLRNARLAFEARQIERTSGSVSANDTTGRTLTDSSATFITDGVETGDWIVNVDDGSGATVITVASETELVTDILDGGTTNQFTIGDAYRIWPVIQTNVSGGNLVAVDDSNNEIDPILPTFGTQVVRASASSATLQELTDIQFSSFLGGVTVDQTSSFSGTTFPIGTPRAPVNNFVDALAIATARGLPTIYIRGNATLSGALDFTNYTFIGQGDTATTVTIDGSVTVPDTVWDQMTVTGTMDGTAFVKNCTVDDLSFFSGTIKDCTLIGTTTLDGVGDTQIINCVDGLPGVARPVIDMGGTGSALGVAQYSGGLRLQNKSGSEPITIDMVSGLLELANDVTNGSILVRGVGLIEDSSAGASVNIDGLVNSRFGVYEGRVVIDPVNGVAGTQFPIGTSAVPSNNATDAITIANEFGIQVLVVRGTVVFIGINLSGFVVMGENPIADIAVLQVGTTTNSTTFRDCIVTGAANGPILVERCGVTGLLNVGSDLGPSLFNDCILLEGVSIQFNPSVTTTENCSIINSVTGRSSGTSTIIDWNGSLAGGAFKTMGGSIVVRNYTQNLLTQIGFVHGELTVESSCTGGTIQAEGVVHVHDDSNGTTVQTEHVLNPSDLKITRQINDNRLEVDIAAQQLILYDDDGITVIRRWPLGTDGGEDVATANGVQTKRLPSTI